MSSMNLKPFSPILFSLKSTFFHKKKYSHPTVLTQKPADLPNSLISESISS